MVSGPADATTDAPLLHMRGICKSFGSNCVLRDVDFELAAGEVHVLAGENGAGKSTLIKILGGVHAADRGRIEIRGRPRRFRSPRHAAAGGVAIIHQELALVPALSVADNIFLGHEQTSGGWLKRRQQERQAAKVLRRLGVAADVGQPIDSFPIATQQLIEIAKALVLDAELIVMDEPTSALREPEVERLFAVIEELKRRGCGVVYITHKLEEVYRIADRITVLRDGQRITTAPAAELPAPELIHRMVGRELPQQVQARSTQFGAARLTVADFSVWATTGRARPLVDRLTFEVRAGEIVGVAGLAGSGNSDVLWAVVGAHPGRVSGSIRIEGRPYRPRSLRHAIRHGLALVTNDRQRYGLVPQMSVRANTTLTALRRVSPGGWLSGRRERRAAGEMTGLLDLRVASLEQPVWTLSGGNQQKVVLGKWLLAEPRILLLDEPTRGVDVGAKQEIYELMHRWSAAGHAIVLITSELPELLLMSDRIIVMHRGRRVRELDRGEATQERILHAAMGGTR